MRVTFFHRRPLPGYFSLERLFRDVRAALPTGVESRVHVARFASLGLFKRVYNILEAPFYQGEVNHITGDIHYVDFLLSKRRTLLTIPDCASLERLRGWRRAVLQMFWYTLPVRGAALVSVISEATKTELLRYVDCPPEKIRVVHCCVSSDLQSNPRPFNTAYPRVLHVGTGNNKNLLRVAEALSGIPCHMEIIGRLDVEQEAALWTYGIDFEASAQVTDEAVVRAYHNCDLVVFVSTYEGFGLPIAEANTVGRPVVTSDLLSMPEVAGDAACLINPFDVGSIRAGILRVIQDAPYRQSLIENGYKNAVRFAPVTIAGKYVELYHELLESHAP